MAKETKAKKSTPLSIIKTGGKQYVVQEGDVVTTEIIPDTEVGDEITFDQVLLTDDGDATELDGEKLKKTSVTGEIVEKGRGKKIEIIRFHPKSRYTRRQGHRQEYMKVKITKV